MGGIGSGKQKLYGILSKAEPVLKMLDEKSITSNNVKVELVEVIASFDKNVSSEEIRDFCQKNEYKSLTGFSVNSTEESAVIKLEVKR